MSSEEFNIETFFQNKLTNINNIIKKDYGIDTKKFINNIASKLDQKNTTSENLNYLTENDANILITKASNFINIKVRELVKDAKMKLKYDDIVNEIILMYSLSNNNNQCNSNDNQCNSTIDINQTINLQDIEEKLNYNAIHIYKESKDKGYIFINIPFISNNNDNATIHINLN